MYVFLYVETNSLMTSKSSKTMVKVLLYRCCEARIDFHGKSKKTGLIFLKGLLPFYHCQLTNTMCLLFSVFRTISSDPAQAVEEVA